MGTLPRLPYVVVDSNQLRVPEVIDPLLAEFDRTGQHIMLPWTSTHELTKGGGDNFVRSVQWLQQRPAAISVAYATIRLFQERERRFRRPVTCVTHPSSTTNLRKTLGQLADGAISPEQMKELLRPMAQQAEELVTRLNFAKLFRDGADGIAKDIPARDRHAMRLAAAKGDREPMRRAFSANLSCGKLHGYLVQIGIRFVMARKLAHFPSFAALNLLGSLMLSFRRAVVGGIENTRQLENDGIDLENVIIALYGRGFVSKDRQAQNLFEDLRAAAIELWP